MIENKGGRANKTDRVDEKFSETSFRRMAVEKLKLTRI
jgi:hypothetical protein